MTQLAATQLRHFSLMRENEIDFKMPMPYPGLE